MYAEQETKAVWEGVVISATGVSTILKVGKPFNAIFFRIKNPETTGPMRQINKLTGYIRFGWPTPAVGQASRAIRYAIWGNETFRIGKENKMKSLLLAKDSQALYLHPRGNGVDGKTERFLPRL